MLLWSKSSEQTTCPEHTTGRTESSPTKKCPKQLRWESSSCSPNFKQETPRLHTGVACDRPEPTKTPKLQPIPEVVWQQPPETFTDQYSLDNTTNDSTKQQTIKKTLASQTSPPKGIQPQNYAVTMEQPPGNQTRNEQVPFLNCSNNCSTDIQESKQHVTTTFIRHTTLPPLTTTTTLIEERLVRDEQTNGVYLPLTSTVVLKPKQE